MHTNTPDQVSAQPPAEIETLITHVTGWFAAVRGKTRTVAALAAAETKLAAISLAAMAFFATIAAVATLVAWGLAIAGVAYALVQFGLSVALTLVILAGAHVGVAFVAWRHAMHMARNAEFRGTRSILTDLAPQS